MTRGGETSRRHDRVRLLRRIAWSTALVTFVVGFFVGLNVNAHVGATLWILTALLTLAPFISHRDKLGYGDGP